MCVYVHINIALHPLLSHSEKSHEGRTRVTVSQEETGCGKEGIELASGEIFQMFKQFLLRLMNLDSYPALTERRKEQSCDWEPAGERTGEG